MRPRRLCRSGSATRDLVMWALLAPLFIACDAGSAAGTGGASAQAPDNFAAAEPCTTLPQHGCPDEHTCQVVSTAGETSCVKAGELPVGSVCSTSSDCAPSLLCSANVCRAYCDTNAECPVGASCAPWELATGEALGRICTTPCNPADPGNASPIAGLFGCAPGDACFPLDEPGFTDCFPPSGARMAGQSCDGDCASGLICLSDGNQSTCAPLCLMGIPGCSCESFAEPWYVTVEARLVEVGYCG